MPVSFVKAVAASCALMSLVSARSFKHRKPIGYNARTMFISPDDPKFKDMAAAIPDIEISDGSEPNGTIGEHEFEWSVPSTSHRTRRQAPACATPTAQQLNLYSNEINSDTNWHAFPAPTSGGIWVSWARESQQEMIVTIPRVYKGDNQRQVWLSTDAGGSFDAIALPADFPNNTQITKCFYGNANNSPNPNPYNVYCTVKHPHGFFAVANPNFIGFLFSNDGGNNWKFMTTKTAPSSAYPNGQSVPMDYIDPHPTAPGAFVAHRTIDASAGLYRAYYGSVGSGEGLETQVTVSPLTPTSLQQGQNLQILVWWAGWSTGGENAANTIFIMAQEAPNVAPYNGMSLRSATISSLASEQTNPVSFPLNPIINDLYDFTQIKNFSIAEVTIAHEATQSATEGGFNSTTLMLSTDGVKFSPAALPVGPNDLAEYFEVVDVSGGQVTLAAQHSTARLQGDVVVNVQANGNTLVLNASRALFSDAISDADDMNENGQPANFIFDPTNPWGCNASWNFSSWTPNENDGQFFLVVRRGNYPGGPPCYFATKLENAIAAGAAGLVVVNNRPSSGRPTLYMVAPEGYDTSEFGSIPCVIVSQTEGEQLIGNITASYAGGYNQIAQGAIYETNLQAQKLWQFTQLYISDGTNSFSRSLRNVLYVVNRGVEYVGVYRVDSMGLDPAFSASFGSGTFLANLRGNHGTVVTTNRGATWSPARLTNGAPLLIVLDALGAQHGWSTPKSVVTAPGLVVANAAASLNRGAISPTVYISRDGGLTWASSSESASDDDDSTGNGVPARPYLFDILDHGSVIVLVETNQHSSVVYYSLDEGRNFNEYSFYNATTLLGRWHQGHSFYTCYPVYRAHRYGATGGTNGFVLFCAQVNLGHQVSTTVNFTVDVASDPTGFSGTVDGMMGMNHDATITISNDPSMPIGTSVTYNPSSNTVTFGNGVVWVRPGRANRAHNIRFLATLTNFQATSTKIFAYWFQRHTSGNTVLGLRMDFGAALASRPGGQPRVCGSTDFEDFRVVGGQNTCYLGSNATVKRRVQCTVCLQNSSRAALSTEASWTNRKPCGCRTYDYACVYGYRRVDNVQANASASPLELCTKDTTVPSLASTNKPYRLLPGDECRGQIPQSINANAGSGGNPGGGGTPSGPNSKSGGGGGGSSNTAAVAAVIILVVLGVGVGVVLLYKYKFGGASGPRYMEIRADNGLATAADAGEGDDDDEDDEADDDLIDASIA